MKIEKKMDQNTVKGWKKKELSRQEKNRCPVQELISIYIGSKMVYIEIENKM